MAEQLYQDITITVNLSEISPEDYKKMFKKLEEISLGKPVTITYPENLYSTLSKEHKELLEKFQ